MRLRSSDSAPNDRKSILFVAPSAFPLGGVATWLDYLVKGLHERGWITHVGLASGSHHDPGLYLRNHPFERPEIFEAPTGTVEGRTRALASLIDHLEPDIVASANVPDVFRAANRLRRRGKCLTRAVMTLHALQKDFFEDLRIFADVLDGIICTNRLTEALARQSRTFDASRVHYAPYGVETQQSTQPSRRDVESFRILYCGRFDQAQKRVLDLPGILAALDSYRLTYSLTVAGGGPLESNLRAALAPWIETGQAHFSGGLDSSGLAEEYGRADALLITSSWETGPIVAWEAMAAGVPVVSSRFLGSGLEGALVDGESSLLFPVGDAGGAAECLVRLAGDPEMREKLRRNAKKLVCERYSTSHSVEQWAGALNRILERPPRGAAQSLPSIQPQGRLDRLLRVGAAETVRRLLHRRFEHSGPGGEWPHSYGDPSNDDEFLAFATELDRRTPIGAGPTAVAATSSSRPLEAGKPHGR